MKSYACVLIGSAMALAACDKSADGAANQTAANIAQPAKKRAYCFFKDEEMKGWAASRGKDGNIVLKGKAHVKDPRYKPVLGEPTVEAGVATLSPSISQNDTGFATPDDWWDLSTTLPNSGAVTEVKIQCGGKTAADLQVPAKS